MFGKVLLLGSAAMFAAFGVVLAAKPDKLGDWLGIVAMRPEARTELRAFYGGLELGLAAFLVVCALRPTWLAAGCFALAFVNGGIAAARVVGMATDGSTSPMMLSFLAVEIVLCVLGVWAGVQAHGANA